MESNIMMMWSLIPSNIIISEGEHIHFGRRSSFLAALSLAYIGNASVFDFGGYSFMGGLVSTENRFSFSRLSLLGGNVCLAEYLLERASIDAHPCLAHG
jgi:hypothetical protein